MLKIPETEKKLFFLQGTLSLKLTAGFAAFEVWLLNVMVKAMEMRKRREDILELVF